MKYKSNENTRQKKRLLELAEIFSGIYAKNVPTGDIACLQVKDLLMASPETTSSHIDYTSKMANYILRKGDLLFAGKGTTYLCQVFNLDMPAVPSTTLYSIRLRSDIISPEYLCWYMNHPSIVALIKTAQVGTGTPMIHKTTLENLEIIIPNKDTQEKIVALSNLQKREVEIIRQIADRRTQMTNQLLINVLNK